MQNKQKVLTLDPRTKLLILLLSSLFVMGGFGGGHPLIQFVRHALVGITLFFLLTEGKIKPVLFTGLFYAVFYAVEIFVLPTLHGMANYVVLFCTGFFVRILPNFIAAYLVVSTTKVSDLIAALKKMKVSNKIIIPLSVIIRFFPVMAEENAAIAGAMKMRGIYVGGTNPGKMLEYRLIPTIICSVKAGEELSAAALARGLGSPVTRTNLSVVGFNVCDWFIFLFTIFAMVSLVISYL